jgi:hypothetical protein
MGASKVTGKVAGGKRSRWSKQDGKNKRLKDAKPHPEGENDGPKRTPFHIADGYRGHPKYEVEAVVAHSIYEGKERYKVKWVGIPNDGNTWEPEAHLVGDGAQLKLSEYQEMRGKKKVRPALCSSSPQRMPYRLRIPVLTFPVPFTWIVPTGYVAATLPEQFVDNRDVAVSLRKWSQNIATRTGSAKSASCLSRSQLCRFRIVRGSQY